MTCGLIEAMLKKEIEVTRKSMVSCGMKNGLTHKNTINLSHHLDKLLNELNKSNADEK